MSNNIGNENDVKLITLDHIQQIKDYIDKTDANLNYRIDNELKDYISDELKQAAEHIQADHDSKYKELQDQLAYLEQFGTQEEINAIKLKIEALEGNTQNKFEALDGLERELGRLSGDYQELYDGIITGKVFNAGQLDEIINTALIDKTTITDDMVETPNVYTSNLVALIGKFGQINAANIVGGEISGHTIQSNNKMVGTDTPVWQIKEAGDGHLAQENIKWDTDGNVTFGPGVKITFDNVQGAEDKLKDLMSNYDEDLQKYVEEAVKTSAAGAISRAELEQRVKETKDAADEAIETLTNTVNLNKESIETDLQTRIDLVNQQIEQARADGNAELEAGLLALKETLEGQLATAVADVQQSLNTAIDAVNDNIEASYNLSAADLQAGMRDITTAYEKAIADGNIEMATKLAEIKGELSGKITTLNNEYTAVTTAINNIKFDVKDLQNSALTADNVSEVLATALIDRNEISDTQVITPTLLAKKIVGLIGNFGTINASKIVGTNIQGYTVSSPLDVKDADGNPVYTDELEVALDDNGNPMYDEDGNPVYVTMLDPATGEYVPVYKKKQIDIDKAAWVLKSDGSGHIANRNIRWEADGTVKLDPSVTIKWESVDGGKDYVDDQVSDIAQTVRGEFKNQLDLDIASAKSELLGDIGSLSDTLSSTETAVSTLQSNYNNLNTTVKGIADTEIFKEGIFTGTIRSSAYEVNENGTVKSTPYWMLDYLGNGHLAKGNIKWDKNGNVEFGPDVTISWNSVDGAQAAVDGAISDAVGDIDTTAINKVATKIDANGVYTGTIKSNNNAWELKEDGSGYLANGGIKWGTGGGLLLKGAIKHKWKQIDPDTTGAGGTKRFIINNNGVSKVDDEYVPTDSNFKIMSQTGSKNIVLLPTSDHWDGTEITIMNNGNADLYLGNALITDDENSKGEISSYNDAITDSGLSYAIGAGALMKLIGVKDHFFKAISDGGQNVSWFTTSSGSSKYVRSYPLYIQFWSYLGDGQVGPFTGRDWTANNFNMTVAICKYSNSNNADDGLVDQVINLVSPTAGFMTDGITDPVTGVNYISQAPSTKIHDGTNTLCAWWSDLNSIASGWLFNEAVWNSSSQTYIEIYIQQSVSNSALAFQRLYLCNYLNDSPLSSTNLSQYEFDLKRTNKVPYFVGVGNDTTYWYRYRLPITKIASLVKDTGLTVTPTPQSFARAFNSKWDPEANSGNGAWLQKFSAGPGTSSLVFVGDFINQSSIIITG